MTDAQGLLQMRGPYQAIIARVFEHLQNTITHSPGEKAKKSPPANGQVSVYHARFHSL